MIKYPFVLMVKIVHNTESQKYQTSRLFRVCLTHSILRLLSPPYFFRLRFSNGFFVSHSHLSGILLMQNGKFGIIFDKSNCFFNSPFKQMCPLLNLGPLYFFLSVSTLCVMSKVFRSISFPLPFFIFPIHDCIAKLE